MTYNVMTIQAGTPTISSFTSSSSYVNVDSQVTLHYAATFPHCNAGEVVIDGVNEARLEPDYHRAIAATGTTSGSVTVTVPDWTKYTLTARCRDNGASATATTTVNAYNPNPGATGTVTCFEVECANSPCTVQQVYAASEDQAQQLIDGSYGSQSGCSASPVDCSEATSSCPDPFQ
jgi:hypothetical protein